jgi:hypothetical protein
MEAILLLCDHAAVAEGKLYINGAGWTWLKARTPAPVSLAILVRVGWDEANIQHSLMTEDGHPALNPDGEPWKAEGFVEVGRPPGMRHGTPLDAPLALNFPAVPLLPGRYRWELIVSDNLLASAEFDAVDTPVASK